MPTVARINEEGSPIAVRHSCFINVFTSSGKLEKCAFTLFLSISPDKDLVGSSVLTTRGITKTRQIVLIQTHSHLHFST